MNCQTPLRGPSRFSATAIRSLNAAIRNSSRVLSDRRLLLPSLLLLGALSFCGTPQAQGQDTKDTEKKNELSAEDQAKEARWNRFGEIMELRSSAKISDRSALDAYLKLLASDAKNTELAPFILYSTASLYYQLEDLKGAKKQIDSLKKDFPNHYLNTREMTALRIEVDEEGSTTSDHALRVIGRQAEWRKENPVPWKEPEPAASPKVVLETDKGDLVIVLYPEAAPKHVENFLKLVGKGFYDGVWFHRVDGFRILVGDSNTKKENEKKGLLMGAGGPDYQIDQEPNLVQHTRGTISGKIVRTTGKSHGSQFAINTGYPTFLDLRSTVFGRVESGIEVADQIAALPLENFIRPKEKVYIKSARILR